MAHIQAAEGIPGIIAATFSMFNRYVDDLASFTPDDPSAYAAVGKRMAENGYVMPVKQS